MVGAVFPRRPYPLLTVRLSSGTELERDDDTSDIGAGSFGPPRNTIAVVAAEIQPQLHGAVVHVARGGIPDSVSGLSAGLRRLDELYRRAHRPGRHLRWT